MRFKLILKPSTHPSVFILWAFVVVVVDSLAFSPRLECSGAV